MLTVDGSDEDDDSGMSGSIPTEPLQGTLSKWTNYIHGWQNRFISLRDGNLVYYKTAGETEYGCRGAVSIGKAEVRPHELDELRFDVSVNDCVWYLRAASVEDRQKWIDGIERYKHALQQLQFNGSAELGHRRQGSNFSTSSNTLSTGSRIGGGKGKGLAEKLAEIETFRDILCRQIDTLQGYFDDCAAASATTETSQIPEEGVATAAESPKQGIDFKGEAITFKATTAGILATLSHCIELMNQKEEYWKKKFDREQVSRRLAEERYRNAMDFAQPAQIEQPQQSQKIVLKSGPDFEEGPHSQIGEDEFYDAVENALDKFEEELEFRDKLKEISLKQLEDTIEEDSKKHSLWLEIDEVTKQQLHYARLLPGKDGVWELFAEDGEMRMYKREEEVDGMVVDPLKALHQVRGVTARELCHYFFSPDVRMEWETTVEQASVIEKISNDTLLFLQLHKRVWPSAQRDACFWSHMRKVEGNDGDDIHDTWVVCNKSVDHPKAPKNQNGRLRVDLTVIFVCNTVIDERAKKRGRVDLSRVTRDDISCKITYCSVVNPGGWAPASVLRTVYKREYPRFLKRFTKYVIDKSVDKPLMW